VTATDEKPNNALGRQLIRHAEAISQLRRDLDQVASDMTDAVADPMTRLESTEDPEDSSSIGRQGGPPGAGGTSAPRRRTPFGAS
jgi:hypothetical protein